MSIPQKYLKDENGDIFSPVTSVESVYNSDGEAIPQIVAWCYATMSSGVVTIKSGSNISKITQDSVGTYTVTFKKNIKDVNYASIVICEVDGYGQEIVGAYDHRTSSFKFDVTNHSGSFVAPTQINIVVVR